MCQFKSLPLSSGRSRAVRWRWGWCLRAGTVQNALTAAALSHFMALHILVGTGKAGLCPKRHIGTLACSKTMQFLLYLQNHLYSFTCLCHVLQIQTSVTDGVFLHYKFYLGEMNQLYLHHKQSHSAISLHLQSNRKLPPEVDVSQGQCCCELQEQEDHMCTVPICLCHLVGHCRERMLSLWRSHAASTSLTRSSRGGRRQFQKLTPQNWEGFFHVPCWN